VGTKKKRCVCLSDGGTYAEDELQREKIVCQKSRIQTISRTNWPYIPK
jgi:hypothetical protein